MTLVQERLSRRPAFRDGMQIRLADDQTWTFPAPPKASESAEAPFGTDYRGIIQAIMDASDHSEEGFAELALAIYLLGCNYCLSPPDYERLLGFASGSPESTAAQFAFHRIAQEHIHSFLDASGVVWHSKEVAPTTGRLGRLVAWLRVHLRFGWSSVDSRGY